jgi:D-sedoheptulose 7-phosphate isomerase
MISEDRIVSRSLEESSKLLIDSLSSCKDDIVKMAEMVIGCLKSGGKVLLCGNGGSAADAQHIACELAGRFNMERPGLTALSLTTNTSTLTAVANDYGFQKVFSRQVEALGSPGDLLIALSTSGVSPNILDALRAARNERLSTAGLSGKGGGEMADLCDLCIVVPSDSTPRIQEVHITIGHAICDLVERAFFGDEIDV